MIPMPALVIDTDVVSFLYKKDTRARTLRRHLVGKERIISFMTLAELEQWMIHRGWGTAARESLERHLQGYAVYNSDRTLCRLWGEVREEANQKGPSHRRR